ncbi:MAG: ABC transporter permease subunit [Acidilobaceae archaeon]|nr:ABC transporter permease subunit [Acidilobaceae archaeon]MCX8165018.1 ABC transporter permease subunit [Acidilobaceae archaeon]MDW7974465.1 ABC transporter permease subunit [Sulfolobales archaeon]
MLSYISLELRLRRRALLGWAFVMFLFIAITVWSWGAGEGEELQKVYEELFRQLPEDFIKLFGKGVPETLNLESYYVINYFVLVHIVLLGAYSAYAGAGAVVDDVLERTGPLYLSLPISRRRLLLSRFLSIMTIVGGASLSSLIITYLTSLLFGAEELLGSNVLLLHLHSIPYLALCVSVGMLLGTVLPFTLAKPVAAGLVVLDYAVDTMSMGTDLEFLGYLTASRYYPALEVAVEGTVSALDVGVLTLLSAVALFVAAAIYEEKDMPI